MTGKIEELVGIVILNYKKPQMTIRCLDSLLKLEYSNWKAVVVDNDSQDGSVEMVGAAHPWVKIIQSTNNLGYAGGNNLGAKFLTDIGVKFIWILNNDTIVNSDVLLNMIKKVWADPKIGCVGCLIKEIGPGDQPVLAIGGGRISWLLGTCRHIININDVKKIDYITGASMLVPCSVWNQLGGLSEWYFLYWEDADFSLRLRALGWRLAIAVDAEVRHEESATLGRRSMLLMYYMNRSFVRFALTHSPMPLWTLLAGILARIFKRLLTGHLREVTVLWIAVFDGWRGRHKPYTEARYHPSFG